jgi:hypothetical protein
LFRALWWSRSFFFSRVLFSAALSRPIRSR